MDTVFYSIRCANLRSLAFQRRLLRQYGITPARYLMLHVIKTIGLPMGKEGTHWLLQSQIRKSLGVCGMTVSKMVRSLARLGLVKRTRAFYDKRQIIVELTEDALILL